MSLARGGRPLQMRIVTGEKPVQGRVFRNLSERWRTKKGVSAGCHLPPQQNSSAMAGEAPAVRVHSNTLSSSFFLPQSAAACTKARMIGCGFFSVDDNCGWKSVARKKRCVGDSMARISP